MAAKRPSYPMIRARQRRIVDYMASTGKSTKETAKDLSVEPRQLRTFLETKPKKLRKTYNRSEVTRHLYSAGEERIIRRAVRKEKVEYKRVSGRIADIRFYRETPGIPEDLRQRRILELERVRNVMVDKEYRSSQWAFYADRKSIPRGIKEIRQMHEDGDLDDIEYDEIVDAWEEIYNTTYGTSAAA